ncbi:hypothetical protein BV898_07942 [Hypsibius exemplaris]|uniref:Uncharacterized protein n=1 Tax=Hypsibius exemplaris TaxID=2072580 RepID=A0A1W0WS36_HYPEX|nr:hypothetical protein BV898_07942 [Hypsibius exemplaris]
MVSVTRENIKELLPEIEASIADSFFVAIDTEFSGLNLGLEESRESRFDSAEQRYTRLRKNVKEASLLQLGITCFFNGPLGESTDAEENGEIGYRATCYNVVLAPADTGLLEFEAKPLAAEWGAMRFLRSHHFDLNQVVSVGVPHMKAMAIEHFAQRISRGTAALQHNDIDKDSLRQAESEVQQLQRIIDADAGKTTEFVFENLKCAYQSG